MEMRCATDSCTAKSVAGTMPEPARTSSAVPPEPVRPALRCASPKTWLQPCSWRRTMPAIECASHFWVAVVQQLGFQVSNAQRTRLRHQLSSLTEAVGGTLAMSAEMKGGNSLFATCFLDTFFSARHWACGHAWLACCFWRRSSTESGQFASTV